MDHASEGEIPEEDRVLQSNRRRVTFRSDSGNGNDNSGDSDFKTPTRCTANGEYVNEQREQSSECNRDSEKKMCGVDTKKSSDKILGILRPRSVSLSPLVFQALMFTRSRFEFSKLSKAIRRSNETRGCIERLKKQIFQRLEHQQGKHRSNIAGTSPSQSKDWIENGENRPLSLVQTERRMLCLQSTKAMMEQSLPPSMMPFVEEKLKAAHFLRRRRQENGHGRIVHKILIEQHIQVLKELEQNEDRNGETSHSSRHQS